MVAAWSVLNVAAAILVPWQLRIGLFLFFISMVDLYLKT